jgi:hypothetical protein
MKSATFVHELVILPVIWPSSNYGISKEKTAQKFHFSASEKAVNVRGNHMILISFPGIGWFRHSRCHWIRVISQILRSKQINGNSMRTTPIEPTTDIQRRMTSHEWGRSVEGLTETKLCDIMWLHIDLWFHWRCR